MTEIEIAEAALRALEEEKRAAMQRHDVHGRELRLAESHFLLGGTAPERLARNKLADEYHAHAVAHAEFMVTLDGRIADAMRELQIARVRAEQRQQSVWSSGEGVF
jgi:hypothetical protein